MDRCHEAWSMSFQPRSVASSSQAVSDASSSMRSGFSLHLNTDTSAPKPLAHLLQQLCIRRAWRHPQRNHAVQIVASRHLDPVVRHAGRRARRLWLRRWSGRVLLPVPTRRLRCASRTDRPAHSSAKRSTAPRRVALARRRAARTAAERGAAHLGAELVLGPGRGACAAYWLILGIFVDAIATQLLLLLCCLLVPLLPASTPPAR